MRAFVDSETRPSADRNWQAYIYKHALYFYLKAFILFVLLYTCMHTCTCIINLSLETQQPNCQKPTDWNAVFTKHYTCRGSNAFQSQSVYLPYGGATGTQKSLLPLPLTKQLQNHQTFPTQNHVYHLLGHPW